MPNSRRPTESSATLQRPSFPRMLGRGLTRRCPWCGDRRAYFTGWFRKGEACVRCGTPWRRDDVGFELGAATMSIILTGGAIVLGGGAMMIATAPDIEVVPIVIVLLAIAIVVPTLTYPITYTTWQAVDLLMRPLHADDQLPVGDGPHDEQSDGQPGEQPDGGPDEERDGQPSEQPSGDGSGVRGSRSDADPTTRKA